MSDVVRHYDLRGQALLEAKDDLLSKRDRLWLHRAGIRAFELWLATLPPQARLLDFCCGTGLWSGIAARRHLKVTGIDVSQSSIAAAHKMAQTHGLTIQWVPQKAEEFFANPTEAFDAIWVSGSMYYFDRRHVLPQLLQCLTPSGSFASLETNGSNIITNAIRHLRHAVQRHRDQRTLSGLIHLKEFRAWRSYFHSSSIIYLDFLTLLTPALGFAPPLAKLYFAVASYVDRFILNTLGLHFLAFKVFFIGKGPKPHE